MWRLFGFQTIQPTDRSQSTKHEVAIKHQKQLWPFVEGHQLSCSLTAGLSTQTTRQQLKQTFWQDNQPRSVMSFCLRLRNRALISMPTINRPTTVRHNVDSSLSVALSRQNFPLSKNNHDVKLWRKCTDALEGPISTCCATPQSVNTFKRCYFNVAETLSEAKRDIYHWWWSRRHPEILLLGGQHVAMVLVFVTWWI